MLFKYKAIKPDGNRIEGTIESVNRDDAIATLQDKHLIIVSVEKTIPKEKVFSTSTGFNFLFQHKVKEKDLVVFSRQIATLFSSGISALRSFKLSVSTTENPTLKKALQSVVENIRIGMSISDALGKETKIFGTFYVNMVKAGEESGKLDKVFDYLADYLDRNYTISQKIKKASIYPLFVITTFTGVMIVMITFVIPRLADMLFSQGGTLPLITRVVLGMGTIAQKYGILILIVVLFLGYYVYSLLKTEQGKEFIDYAKLKIPVFKSLYKKIFLSRLTDNMDTMLSSGVKLVEAITITADVVDNVVYKDILMRVAQKVKTGQSLSQAFYQEPDLPDILVQMTKIGEETGRLSYILNSLSSYYRREVSTAIDTTLSMIEPVMIILLAGGVGLLIAAVMIPMFDVVNTV